MAEGANATRGGAGGRPTQRSFLRCAPLHWLKTFSWLPGLIVLCIDFEEALVSLKLNKRYFDENEA